MGDVAASGVVARGGTVHLYSTARSMRPATSCPLRAEETNSMRFKISKSRDGQYYFEIQAGGNYATLATSETYKHPNKRDVRAAIDQIKREATGAEVVDDTN